MFFFQLKLKHLKIVYFLQYCQNTWLRKYHYGFQICQKWTIQVCKYLMMCPFCQKLSICYIVFFKINLFSFLFNKKKFMLMCLCPKPHISCKKFHTFFIPMGMCLYFFQVSILHSTSFHLRKDTLLPILGVGCTPKLFHNNLFLST